MFVITYRYHLAPERAAEMLALQQQSLSLYQQHVPCRFVCLQSQSDATEWLELTWFPSKEAHDAASAMLSGSEELLSIYKQFKAMLDPAEQSMNQQYFDAAWVAGELDPAALASGS